MDFHVDESLLLTCLQNAYPRSAIAILDYEDGQYAVEPGTNYSSEIVRVSVRYVRQDDDDEDTATPAATTTSTTHTEHLVFKVPYLNAHFAFLDGLGFYDKETYMYDAVLPEMASLLDGAVVPRHYHTAERHVLALEDLSARGYYLRTRAALDYEHGACVVRGLAAFHAASARLHRRRPRLLAPAAREALYTRDIVVGVIRACYPVLRAALRGERVPAGTLRRFAAYERRIDDADDVCAVGDDWRNDGGGGDDDDRFKVLNHGDLKTNNIMFAPEGDDGRPTAVKLLDYQTCRWNSPVLDLVFFYMATVDYEVYAKRGDQLRDHYLAELKATLDRLGCESTYAVDEYEADMKGCTLFRVFTLVWIGFLDIREVVKDFDYHRCVRLEQDAIDAIRRSDAFRNRFLKWFRHFERQGLF